MSYESLDHLLEKSRAIPLLTPDEEIHLAHAIQRMNAIRAEKPSGPYSRDEQGTIRRGTRARDRFICANIRLVATIAGKYHRAMNSSMDLHQADLIGEGMFGLIRAVEKFDPTRGYKFSTYAYWWIRQSITRGMQTNGRAVRLPAHIHDQMYALRRHAQRMTQELGRAPRLDELAEVMGWPRDLLEQALNVSSRPMSLDGHCNADVSNPLSEAVADVVSTGDHMERLSEEMDHQRVREILGRLPMRDRQMLELRYGLTGEPPESLTSIGRRFGCTREAVRQRCATAMRRVEKAIRTDPQFRLAPEWTAA